MDKNKIHIILGTAHLGTTPGKCSPDGKFREALWSREMCDQVKLILENAKYNVHIDYPSLDPSSKMKAGTPKKEQSLELQERVRIVNELSKKYGVQNCLHISIHVNAAGDGSKWLGARGWSAYTSPGQTKSDLLADCLYTAAKNNMESYQATFTPEDGKQKPFRSDMTDGDQDLEERLYVLTKTSCPAVLTENLFQDNKKDLGWLTSDEGFHGVSKLHAEGIMMFCEKYM